MRTKFLCVLIHTRIKGEVGTVRDDLALQYVFTDRFKAVLLMWILFLLFMCHVCIFYAVLSVFYSLVITCWEMADHLAILCVIFAVDCIDS